MHPLQHVWTFCIRDMNDEKSSWIDSFKKQKDFATIEDFFSIYPYFQHEYTMYTIYSIFQKGISPAWEDDINKKGCSIHVHMMNPFKGKELFEYLSMLIVGNTIDNDELGILGLTVDIRFNKKTKQSKWKLSVWFKYIDTYKEFISHLPDEWRVIYENCKIDYHSNNGLKRN